MESDYHKNPPHSKYWRVSFSSLKILAGGLFLTQNIGGWAGHMPYISDPAWPNLTAANHLPSIQRRKNVKTPQKSTQTICL